MTETKKYEMTIKDKAISVYLIVGAVVQFLMMFLYGNWFNLDILFYVGLLFAVISGVLILSSNVLKEQGEMEKGKGFVTTKLVDSGIYGIIRHPIYGSLFYLFIGFALISQHPVSLFFGLTMSPFCYYFMLAEEKMTINKFGDEYVEYMKKVPRLNLLIGLWRKIK